MLAHLHVGLFTWFCIYSVSWLVTFLKWYKILFRTPWVSHGMSVNGWWAGSRQQPGNVNPVLSNASVKHLCHSDVNISPHTAQHHWNATGLPQIGHPTHPETVSSHKMGKCLALGPWGLCQPNVRMAIIFRVITQHCAYSIYMIFIKCLFQTHKCVTFCL